MRSWVIAFVLTVANSSGILYGQLPEFYNEVDRMTWIVEDLETTIEGWAKLGFTDLIRHGEVELPMVRYREKSMTIRARAATVLFGNVPVDWIQPTGGANAYTDFLTRHGSGIFSLLHQVPSRQQLEGEVQRLQRLGVSILQRGQIPSGGGSIEYVYMDTEPEGKYVLGLFATDGSLTSSPLALPASAKPSRRITQYAFVVQNLDSVSAFWAKLGFPEMEVTHPYLWDLKYHEEEGNFDAKLGWQRHGKVQYEWILPLKGPTVYMDHLEEHGEGVHHLAFPVDDFFHAIDQWNGLGFQFIQGGAWGEEGKTGYGRFAYQDTDRIGGIDIELLWNYHP